MRYAIIGAGLAGLVTATEIRRADADATIDVFEADDRIGGKLFTVPFASGPTDMGAEAYLAFRADATAYFEELGLGELLRYPSGLRSLVYSGGQTHPLPAVGVMGIPSSSEPVAHLVSAESAARIDAEGDQDTIAWPVGGDLNLGALVRERYGDEVVDRVVSSLLGGVYSCLADDLGVRATVPQLAAAFDALATAGEKVTLSGAVARVESQRPAPSGDPKPVFASFDGGYAVVYEALAEASGADIHLDAFVSGVTRGVGGFTITGAGEGTYDRVVFATPAPTTAMLLRSLSPEASVALKSIKLASSVVVGMKFDSSAGLPDNSGVLVAADEPDVRAKAFTLSSKKWPHLGERGGALVRASFGRFGEDEIVRADEDDLVDWALDDLQTVTGFDGREAGLAEIYVQRWFGGLPRYDETHLATVEAVRSELASVPGVEVTGAWAGGVGVPAVIADARAAVARLLG
ncbi:protoporphyrinogen oxidase [Corynebacterium testudinoris]|uniref:Coproporphyrinogen III oxidase n=1 Tax=Corynebacterium testudinoris TaxID=136857 RepID=A0A0G3H9H9_9CORY|nr:protoporphyrinogen oxidase [Corynebacterium testudinoris]AKK07797.1 protoporphyrinogen oxidase [Corynebacterium testudinoris]MBX8995902.1 protoporphyrinogen oxidase [Corynebacterium testudinoris]